MELCQHAVGALQEAQAAHIQFLQHSRHQFRAVPVYVRLEDGFHGEDRQQKKEKHREQSHGELLPVFPIREQCDCYLFQGRA